MTNNLGIRNDSLAPNNIVMTANQTEWIKITPEGFWVRGVKVEQDEREAQQVYQAFKEFIMWSNLTRNY